MTLLHDFQRILADRRASLETVEWRIGRSTAEIERLMAQNAEDNRALASLLDDIDYLQREVARLQEHELVPASAVEPRAPEPQGDAAESPTRAEVDEIIRARHEAESARGRRRRSRPDPVKAARKAARAAAQEAAQPAEPPDRKHPHYQRDPLRVHPRSAGDRSNVGAGSKKPRLQDLRPAEIDQSGFTPTDLERADLVAEAISDRGGAAFQGDLTDDLIELMGCGRGTAQAIASRAMKVLVAQRRALYAGREKRRPDDRNPSVLWKLAEAATPAERAAANLGCDEDNFAGTTTRWPTASTPTGGRISIEPGGHFEGKR